MSAIRAHVAVGFGEAPALGRHVAVVEGEERRPEQGEHLEGDLGLQLRRRHAVAEPGAQEGLAAEGVAARPGEAVPVGDRHAQLVAHRLAEHHAVGLVEAEGERVVAVGALEGHGVDALEEVAHAAGPLSLEGLYHAGCAGFVLPQVRARAAGEGRRWSQRRRRCPMFRGGTRRMPATLRIDTLKFARKLTEAGMEQRVAEAIVEGLGRGRHVRARRPSAQILADGPREADEARSSASCCSSRSASSD